MVESPKGDFKKYVANNTGKISTETQNIKLLQNNVKCTWSETQKTKRIIQALRRILRDIQQLFHLLHMDIQVTCILLKLLFKAERQGSPGQIKLSFPKFGEEFAILAARYYTSKRSNVIIPWTVLPLLLELQDSKLLAKRLDRQITKLLTWE